MADGGGDGGDGVGGRQVAVKVLRPELARDPDVVARFVRERDVLRAQDHPNLVRVHDLVVDGDQMAIVMDLVVGPNLRGLLRESPGGTLAPASALRLAAQVADALAAVHAAGVVHRDVKPENVLVDRSDPAGPRALVSDFGVAHVASAPALTRITSVIGTPEYLAPEVIDGRPATPAGDLYGLGVLVYELLFGRTPFAASSPAEVLEGHRLRPPPRPEGVPAALWDAVGSLLAKVPADRPPSAGSAARLLASLAAEMAGLAPFPALPGPAPAGSASTRLRVAAPPPPAAPATSPGTPAPAGRRRWLSPGRLAAAAVLVALVVTAAVALPGGDGEGTRPAVEADAPAYAFAPVRLETGLVVARTWSLTGAGGRRLEGLVRVTNTGLGAAPAVVHEELVPRALDGPAGDLAFDPAPVEVVEGRRLVRWQVAALAPGGSVDLRYGGDVEPGADPVERLRRWADEWAEEGGDRHRGAQLASLSVVPEAVEMELGKRLPLRLRGVLSDGTPANPVVLAAVVWSSADPAVVRVDNGTVHALVAGATEVVAQAGDAVARVPVRVAGPAPPPPTTAAPTTRPRRPAPAPTTAAPATAPATTAPPPATASPTTTTRPRPPPRPQTVGVYFPTGTGSGWHLRFTNTPGVADLYIAQSGTSVYPLAGDWNGDGVDTLGWFDLDTGTWYLRNANAPGGADLQFVFGAGTGRFPVVGDWDGDGIDTAGLYYPATGQWLLRNRNSAGPPDATIQYGAPNVAQVPVAGDWNGDGIDTIGIFYTGTAVWDLRNSNSGGAPHIKVVYGATSGVFPVVGDWNGGGVDTIGAFYTSVNRWDLRNTNTAGAPDLSFQYGDPPAFPVAGTWAR